MFPDPWDPFGGFPEPSLPFSAAIFVMGVVDCVILMVVLIVGHVAQRLRSKKQEYSGKGYDHAGEVDSEPAAHAEGLAATRPDCDLIPGPFGSLPYRDLPRKPPVRPIRMYRKDTGKLIGRLSEGELDELRLLLEPENAEQHGYYIHPE